MNVLSNVQIRQGPVVSDLTTPMRVRTTGRIVQDMVYGQLSSYSSQPTAATHAAVICLSTACRLSN